MARVEEGPPPDEYTPLASGYGAGTKELSGRANALRIILAESAAAMDDGVRTLAMLSCDVDDMTPELVADAVESLRAAGALDVICLATQMKKAISKCSAFKEGPGMTNANSEPVGRSGFSNRRNCYRACGAGGGGNCCVARCCGGGAACPGGRG